MCDVNYVNLIDLNLEDDTSCKSTQKNTEICAPSSNANPLFIPASWQTRKSLENNPFDCVQKQVDCKDDPFDIVEKEASLKALQLSKPPDQVKLGNLLSLSDENLLDEDLIADTQPLVTEKWSTTKLKQLDLESPPILFNDKFTPDSANVTDTEANPNSSAETSTSAKLRKSFEHRKRLLKLSMSNATLSSPTTLKQFFDHDDISGTPVASILTRAAEFGEHLIAAESPLKLVEDEHLVSEDALNLTDSEKNFENDLEMLQIPILNELPYPSADQTLVRSIKNSFKEKSKAFTSLENALPNLEEIKAKLKAKKKEINNTHQQEISSLIHNLKSLISREEMVDEIKKQEVINLLESLNEALKPIKKEDIPKLSETLSEFPQPIKRESTFDVDLKEKYANYDDQPLVQEMPNCMVSSSATYDGEPPDENRGLNLPEIDPLSSQALQYPCRFQQNSSVCENYLQDDVHDIIEQLGNILINNTEDNSPKGNNPTFIVVMNGNQVNHSNQNVVDGNQRSIFVSNYIENSVNYGSPDLTEVNSMSRRRSQSLSIHDKVKIFHLSHQPPIQDMHQHSAQIDESPPITKTLLSEDKKTPELKTPARIVRRNSYSSGTPFTAQISLRRTVFGSESRNNPAQLKGTQTLATHHEGRQPIVTPISMPSNNLPTYKLGLKKKFKHNTESIIKSSGPLKATIPVKKVAPLLKTSPPTPKSSTKTNRFHNMSLQSQSKISKVPTTPLQSKRSSTLDVGVNFPNACSTPSAFNSFLKRSTGPLNKSRYSYVSATPSPKSSISNSDTAAIIKRRTICSFQSKSPLKPRIISRVGLTVPSSVASSSRPSTTSSRISISAGARNLKTPAKPTTTNAAAAIKQTNRLNSRVSVNSSVLSSKNKENKLP